VSGYIESGYAIALVTLVGYSGHLLRRRRSLEKVLASNKRQEER
jgi:heme exporter protein D